MKFDLNDPRLTAFALGELQGQEAEEMKKLIENDAEAKQAVEEIRQTADALALELKKEDLPRLEIQEREEILRATENKSRLSGIWRRLQMKVSWSIALPVMGTAMAAAFAVIMIAHQSELKSPIDRIALPTQITQPPQIAQNPQTALNQPAQGGSEVDKVAGLSPQKPTNTVPAEAPAKKAESKEFEPYRFEESDDAIEDEAAPEVLTSPKQGGAVKMEQKPGAPMPAPRKDTNKTGVFSAFGGGRQAEISVGDSNSVGQLAGASGIATKGRGAAVPGAPMAASLAKRKSLASPAELNEGAQFNTESYSHIAENSYKNVADEPLSTFSTDVDTASYANTRRFLISSQLPPKDAVRIEEMINYFRYDYAKPNDKHPFSVNAEVATAPWDAKHKLVRIGLKGKETDHRERPSANLVFLIDVSGSMQDENKLPLVQKSLKMLTEQMRDKDRVAIVVYAGNSGVLLESTPGTKKNEINEAIERLTAGGSTNGAAGIQQAYEIAAKHFVKGGINRVVLATDGDFNVGTTSEGDLVRLIEEKAKTGVFLSVLGFGMGNYKDSNMQKLADKGNGNYAYIDSLREARKALVEQAGGTLVTIAKDVKIQVEFNPRYVASYRLIGYEKRMLNKEDFNDDTKDAGEIGEGHTVTALYEVVPVGTSGESATKGGQVDSLKYQKQAKVEGPDNGEMMNVKLRYKQPEGNTSVLMEVPVKNESKEFEKASSDFKFTAAVAGFGMILRESSNKGDFTLNQVQEIAAKNTLFKGQPDDYRVEFVELVKKARSLKKQ